MRVALIIVLAAILIGITIGFINFFSGNEGGGLPTISGPERDGGVYRSLDGGANFEQFAHASGETDLSRLDLTALFEDPENTGTWWIATAGAGLFVWDQDASADELADEEGGTESPAWFPVWGQDDVLKTATVYGIARVANGGILLARELQGRGRIWKSEDGGATFRETYSAATEGIQISALAVSPVNSSVVLAGLSDGLLIRSEDGGETWSSLTTFGNPIQLLAFARNSDSIMFGVLEGRGLIRSTDGGAEFEEMSRIRLSRDDPAFDQQYSKYPNSRSIYGLAIHPTDTNQLMIATAGGLLRTRDLGQHWEQLPIPLRPESLPLRGVAYDPRNPGILQVTAGDGLYTSFDDGRNWRVTRFTINPALTHLAVSRRDSNLVLIGTTRR